MARPLLVEIIGDSSSLERAFQRSEASARHFNGEIKKVTAGRKLFDSFKGSVVGLGAGVVGSSGITSGIEQAVHAAEDLGTQISRTRAVFGQSSGTILAWSKTT